MESLVRCGLANAGIAAVLAILVAIVTRIWKSPHLAYALWLIVLVRLVSPPLLQIPIHGPDWFAPQPAPQVHEVPQVSADATPTIAGEESRLPPPHLAQINPADASQHAVARPEQVSRLRSGPFIGSGPSITARVCLADVVGGLWIVGTTLYFIVVSLRVGRFARAVRRSQTAAPSWLEDEVLDIVRLHGLRRAPRLMIVEGALPPMVWSSGWRPTLLVPESILTGIEPSGRRLLLLHELLHIRHHDHAVRWFAVVVLALYWWNPFAWWAVRRLHGTEEECCDAGVLDFHPHECEGYGKALLAVSEFVSCGSLPPTALSIGVERKSNLKRRLTMILSGTRWPKLSKAHLSAVFACGVVVVGISLTSSAAQVGSGTTTSAATKVEGDQQNSRIPSPPAVGVKPASATTKVDQAQESKAAQRPDKPGLVRVPYVDDPPVKPAASDDELEKLLKERYNVALNYVRNSYRRLQAGVEAPDNVSDAARRVVDAELALHPDPADEIHARERYLTFAKIIEARANGLAASGNMAREYADAARETRLNAEIQLLQAKRRWQADRKQNQAKVQSLEADVRIAQAEVAAGQATVEQAGADLKRALASLAFRKIQFDRLQSLYLTKAIDERLLEEARHERDAAEASIEGARAFVRAADAQLEIKNARLEKARSELAAAKATL
jgi:beta-lactamase regulating signal transducer with metallopeptidase domain